MSFDNSTFFTFYFTLKTSLEQKFQQKIVKINHERDKIGI